jgi:hypothetical protein
MSEASRVKRAVRTLAVLGTATMASLVSPKSYALRQGVSGSVTCTGGLPNLTIGSGGLHHAEIIPVFWGSSWTPAQQAAVVGMIQQVVNGAYLGALGQYGGDGIQVGPARMVPTAPIRSGTPVAHCSNGAVCTGMQIVGSCGDGTLCGVNDTEAMLNATISAGIVPPPPATNGAADVVYAAFPPAGFTIGARNGHGSWNGRSYTYLWVPAGVALGFTHELVESITNNVTVTNCGNLNNQIVDVCKDGHEVQGGQDLAAYWSAADSACVIPEGWGGVFAYNGVPNSWSQIITSTVRQVDAGGFGLVVSDAADNLMKWNGGTSWTLIGGPVAQFAVGTSNIVRLSPAADAVDVFNGSSWTNIHGPRSAVYAGSRIVTTDFTGTEFSWLNSGDSWANIGKAGDQIVVTGTGRVYGIALDHSAVWMTPDNSTVWSQVGAASTELFGGITSRSRRETSGCTRGRGRAGFVRTDPG